MPDAAHRELGAREHRGAAAALADFETHWQHGASPVFRDLIDREAFELLGGPLAHPFQPLLDPRLRAFSLREGLADAHARWNHTPTGIWGGPECGYTPGHGARVRRSGRHPLHGRRPRLARRHVPRPPGSRIRRSCIRPRPAGQLPRLVPPQVRISGSRRLPRLPHLRPRDGSQAVAGHRTDRRLRRQVAVRPPRTRCGRRRQACCRLRRNRSRASAQ